MAELMVVPSIGLLWNDMIKSRGECEVGVLHTDLLLICESMKGNTKQ